MRRNIALSGLCLAFSAPAFADELSWGQRCEARFTAAIPSLSAYGAVTVIREPPLPQDARHRFGRVTLTADDGVHTWSASIGDEPSVHRYRPVSGIYDVLYEQWHDPSRDAEDPQSNVVAEEFHHRLAVGGLQARWDVPDGEDRGFSAVAVPLLQTCLADVAPLENDPSLVWTSVCLAGLDVAYRRLAIESPIFAGGTCVRDPYAVGCGHVDSEKVPWNAMTDLAARIGTQWRDESTDAYNPRWTYPGGALIWARKVAPADGKKLVQAFQAPLAACSALKHAAESP